MPQPTVTQEWILEKFNDLYPAHLGGMGRLLIALRRHFDGDLDSMLVLLTISAGTEREDWREALLEDYRPRLRVRPTNTKSIADATGIARETVRRKLKTLREKGWVARTENGNWEPTDKAARDLRPATFETVVYLRTIVSAALKTADSDPKGAGGKSGTESRS